LIRKIIILFLSIFWIDALSAEPWRMASLGPSFSYQSLSWQFPYEGESSFPISKLRWNILTGGAVLDWKAIDPPWLVTMELSAAGVISGRSEDRDWMGCFKSLEFCNSTSITRGWTASAALQTSYLLQSGPVWLGPVARWEGRSLFLRNIGVDERFSVEYENRAEGTVGEGCLVAEGCYRIYFSNPCHRGLDRRLSSTYSVWWGGPSIGLGLWVYPPWNAEDSPLTWELLVRGGAAWYQGDADWCLREEFAHPKSFDHYAEALTASVAQKILFRLRGSWLLTLSLSGNFLFASSGQELIYMQGEGPSLSHLSLLRWSSIEGSLSFGRTF
jgi:hypothetical protein